MEYAQAIWSPSKLYEKDLVESVQRRATQQILSLRTLDYTERLKKLKIPTMKYRRLRGDMIEAYKIANHVYNKEALSGILNYTKKP